MAVRNPAENRSLIAFAGWSSVAHAAVMAIMALRDASQRELMLGVYILVVIAIALIVLFPPKKSLERPLGASAKD
jgi:hydrogenase-4 membrane subunit HyfE